MSKMEQGDTQWIHCNRCLHNTRHEVIAVRKLDLRDDNDPEYIFDGSDTYTMLECRGCGGATLRRRLILREFDVDETNYYPPPISRQIPRWHFQLPEDISELLKECYAALQSGSKRLAIMGARSVVDVFMNITLGDIGGFQQKLGELEKQGYLSKQNRDTLEAALEAGHAVVHRGHAPSADDITLIFDIVENMLQTSVLKNQSDQLKKRTPKRKKPTRE